LLTTPLLDGGFTTPPPKAAGSPAAGAGAVVPGFPLAAAFMFALNDAALVAPDAAGAAGLAVAAAGAAGLAVAAAGAAGLAVAAAGAAGLAVAAAGAGAGLAAGTCNCGFRPLIELLFGATSLSVSGGGLATLAAGAGLAGAGVVGEFPTAPSLSKSLTYFMACLYSADPGPVAGGGVWLPCGSIGNGFIGSAASLVSSNIRISSTLSA
jgi:hypothetical protein